MAAPAKLYDELAGVLTGLVRTEAKDAAPKVERWKVVQADPLVIEGEDTLLEEGDPDVEFDRAVLAERPAVGDTVRVHFDGEDWIVSGVIE